MNSRMISNVSKFKNSKRQRMERREQFYKSSIQVRIWAVFQTNAIIYLKHTKEASSSMKFIA